MTTDSQENRVDAIAEALASLGHVESAEDVNGSTLLFSLANDQGTGLNMDSLGMLELMVTLENEFSLSLPEDVDSSLIRTVEGLAHHLTQGPISRHA